MTFGKMSSSAWEYFSRLILSDLNHAFLRWCDDGEWKLREWSTQNYSSWTLNIGLRQKKQKDAKTEGSDASILDDTKLICLQDNEDEDEVNDKDNTNVEDENSGPDLLTKKENNGTPPSLPHKQQIQPVFNLF
jgi:hypothetical protein